MAGVGLFWSSNLSLLPIPNKPSPSRRRVSAVAVKNAISAAEEKKGALSVQQSGGMFNAAKVCRLSDVQLRAKAAEFHLRLSRGEILAERQAEGFSVVREAARRTLGMRHFDVRIIGGAVVNVGCITEMKTGEGNTLVSTLAAYLNALTGNGVHGTWI